MNTLIPLEPAVQAKTPRIIRTDISRGARRIGIHSCVKVETSLLDDYTEADSCLGLNSAGVLLGVLAQHLKLGNADIPNHALTACLIRREDGALVDVDIEVRRSRVGGQECFALAKVGERAAEE